MCHSMFYSHCPLLFHTMVQKGKYSFSFEKQKPKGKKPVDTALYVKILNDTVDVIRTLAIKSFRKLACDFYLESEPAN